MVVASTARGLKAPSGSKDQKVHLNKVMLVFHEILRRQKISAIGAYSTVAEVKHLHQMDIDRLTGRDDPTISQILFQKLAVGAAPG